MTAGDSSAPDADGGGLFLFVRFHALPGHASAVESAIRDVLAETREETGCLGIHLFRSINDPGLFYIHSRWRDEEAFEAHAKLSHTVRFIRRVEALIDHRFESHRTVRIV